MEIFLHLNDHKDFSVLFIKHCMTRCTLGQIIIEKEIPVERIKEVFIDRPIEKTVPYYFYLLNYIRIEKIVEIEKPIYFEKIVEVEKIVSVAQKIFFSK